MGTDLPYGDYRLTFDTQSIKINNVAVATTKPGVPMGIGTLTPNTSAALDITSTVGALLVPRMTTTQKNALTPTNGMILYDTVLNKFQGYENGAWANFI